MNKQYDLEQRTLNFAKEVRNFCKTVIKFNTNTEYVKQLIRSSSSIGANYIEANDSLSKKDFIFRTKIAKKESKETIYWLNLVDCSTVVDERKRDLLINEATEIMKILGSIIQKSL